jgi:hypothetical protein
VTTSPREQLQLALTGVADAIVALVAEAARAGAVDNGSPWLTTEETASLLSTSPGAIRQRHATGWLKADSVRDGKRRFYRREAVLAELERKARRQLPPNEL